MSSATTLPVRSLVGTAAAIAVVLPACGQVPQTAPEPSSPASRASSSAAPTASAPASTPAASARTTDTAPPSSPAASSPAASSPAASSPAASSPAASSPAATGGEECEYEPSGTAARPVDPPSATGVPASGTVTYVLAMTGGNVTITLDRVKAPCTVHSFESLAAQGFYDQTRCHRLTDSTIFILQCGDPTATGEGGPGYSFPDETDGTESYVRGVVAMANGGPNTNGSQFFLVWDDSTTLPASYTIFGTMDEASRGVVARMAEEGQDGSSPAGGGRPHNPSAILSVKRG